MNETLKIGKRQKYLTVLFALVLVGIVAIADLGYGDVFFSLAKSLPYGDKICHFILMGLLSFFANMAFSASRFSASRFRIFPVRVLKGSFIVWAIVTAEEISQLFFEHRTFSVADLMSDYAGILLFGLLTVHVVKKQRGQEPNPP